MFVKSICDGPDWIAIKQLLEEAFGKLSEHDESLILYTLTAIGALNNLVDTVAGSTDEDRTANLMGTIFASRDAGESKELLAGLYGLLAGLADLKERTPASALAGSFVKILETWAHTKGAENATALILSLADTAENRMLQ